MAGRCLLLVFLAAALVDWVKTQGDRPLLLCANKETVRKLDPETKSYTEMARGQKRAKNIDFHYEKGLVIWTDMNNERIFSVPLGSEGPVKQLVSVCAKPDGVAVDWVHDNLYWTDAGKDVIAVARLDGSLVKTLFNMELEEPRAIVLDPAEGLMFWTDWGARPKIERAGMDGTHRTVIVSTGIEWPNGLAIDLSSQTIYWADGRTHVLSSANYDGANENVLISSATTMKHPYSMDILGNYVYWIEWSAGKESINKANRHTGREVTEIVGGRGWSSLMGLKVHHRSKQMPGVSRCVNNGGCTHLCLPSPLRYGGMNHSCACPDSVLPTDNCSTVAKGTIILSTLKTELVTSGDATNERQNQEDTAESSVPTGTIVGVVVGLASLTLVVYYVHNQIRKWKMQSRGWPGIDNPVYSHMTEDKVSFDKE